MTNPRREPTLRNILPTLIFALLTVAGTAARAANPPDVFVVAQSLDDIVSLDPAEGFELSSVQSFTSLYQRLLQPDREHPERLVPQLATRWTLEDHAVTFELRNAVFSSGNPLRPEDVIFSLTRAVKLNRAPAFILNNLGWTASDVDAQVVKVGPNSVQLRWSAPLGAPVVLSILTAPVASIVDEREVRLHEVRGDAGNQWLRAHAAGSGPFKLRRYIPHEALVLDGNLSAPGGGALLRTLILKNVPDAATRRLLVEVGDADMARDLGPDQTAALAGNRRLRVLRFPSAAVHYLLFNGASRDQPALANPALWEAARWLVDYDGIARELLRGQYEVHQAFLAGGFPGALDAAPYHLDIDRARRVLEEAHLGPHLKIKLSIFNQPPYGDIAQSLQATFGRAGIDLDILPSEASDVYSQVRARAEQAVWLYWIPDYFDANSTAGAFAFNPDDGTRTLAWRAGWQIPALTARTRAAALESDPARRTDAYRAIQAEVQRASPFVIALQERSSVVVTLRVRGYTQGLDADMAYYDRMSK